MNDLLGSIGFDDSESSFLAGQDELGHVSAPEEMEWEEAGEGEAYASAMVSASRARRSTTSPWAE